MRPKMQSAIEKITLNDATFTGEIVEPTFVNFFYGKNGAGTASKNYRPILSRILHLVLMPSIKKIFLQLQDFSLLINLRQMQSLEH